MLPLPSFLKADAIKSAAAKVSSSWRLPTIPDNNRTMIAETGRAVGKFVREQPFASIFVASLAVHGLIWATLPNPFQKQAQNSTPNTPKPNVTADPTKLPVVTLPQTNSRGFNSRRPNRGNPLAGLPFLNNLPNILNPNAPKSVPNGNLDMANLGNGLPTITGSNGLPVDQFGGGSTSGNYPSGLPLNFGDISQLPAVETSRDDISNSAPPPRRNRSVTQSNSNLASNNQVAGSDDQDSQGNLIDNRLDARPNGVNRPNNIPNNSNLRPEINPDAVRGSDNLDNLLAPPVRKNAVAQTPVVTPLVTPEPTTAPSKTPPEELISSWDVLYANISSQLNNQVTLRQIALKEEQVANVDVEPIQWIPITNAPKDKKGVVEFALLIAPDGKVQKQFLKSSGDAQLDALVRETIKGYYNKFKPVAEKSPENKSDPKHRLIRIRYLFP